MRRLAQAALALFVFAIPLETAVLLPGVGTLPRAIGYVTAGLAVLTVLASRKIRQPGAPVILTAVFVTWGAATSLWSVDPSLSSARSLTFLQLGVLVWLLWELADDETAERLLLQAYVLGALVAAGAVIANYLRAPDASAALAARFTALGADPNGLAFTLALAIPPAWYLALRAPTSLGEWGHRAAVPVLAFAILLTASRGGVVAAVTALLVVPAVQRRLSPGKRTAAVLAILLAGLVVVALVPASSWSRIATIGAEVRTGTMTHRTVIWEAGLEQLGRRWPFGLGAGAFKSGVTAASRPLVAHNTYLSILVEQGVVGLVLFLALVGSVFAGLSSRPLDGFRPFAIVLLMTLLVGIIPLSWEHKKSLWFVLGLLAARGGGRLSRRPRDARRP